MSLAGRLREAAASGAAVMDLNGDDMAGASHDEKILRQLRHDERELSEQVAQMRAELKRRREDAPTRNAAKRALADASLAVASDATVAVAQTTESGDKFDPTSRQEVEAIASMAGIRVTEASSRVSSTGAGTRVVRTRHYVLSGLVEDAITVRLAFDVNEGALMDKVSDRDINITSAVVRLLPIFAMVELDELISAAESKGAVGHLLAMLPRYARAAQIRKNAFAAARESMRNKCDTVQQESDDDYQLVLRCRPTGAHLFAFDVLWDLDFDAASNRVRSTLAFVCHPSRLFTSTNSKLANSMEHRFLQLVQQSGLLRAVEVMVELAIV